LPSGIVVSTTGQFGATVTSFSDSLGTATAPAMQAGVNNKNWFYTIMGWNLPFNNPNGAMNYNFGSAVAGGGTGLEIDEFQTAANPLYEISTGIFPLIVYQSLYSRPVKFVQITFLSTTATSPETGIGFANFEDLSGTGQAGNGVISHDCYFLGIFNGTVNLVRYNSGVLNATLFSSGVAPTIQDIYRLSMSVNVGNVTLVVTKNGTIINTTVDNNANRVQIGSPGIFSAFQVAGRFTQYKNFSCGLGL
jgi:hypothetical protein